MSNQFPTGFPQIPHFFYVPEGQFFPSFPAPPATHYTAPAQPILNQASAIPGNGGFAPHQLYFPPYYAPPIQCYPVVQQSAFATGSRVAAAAQPILYPLPATEPQTPRRDHFPPQQSYFQPPYAAAQPPTVDPVQQDSPADESKMPPTAQPNLNAFPLEETHTPRKTSIQNWNVIGRKSHLLVYTLPGDPTEHEVDMKGNVPEWLPLETRRYVLAPNPRREHKYCLGQMITTDPHATFAPMDTPDKKIPHIMIKFVNDDFGYPDVSIHRKHIWPAPPIQKPGAR